MMRRYLAFAVALAAMYCLVEGISVAVLGVAPTPRWAPALDAAMETVWGGGLTFLVLSGWRR